MFSNYKHVSKIWRWLIISLSTANSLSCRKVMPAQIVTLIKVAGPLSRKSENVRSNTNEYATSGYDTLHFEVWFEFHSTYATNPQIVMLKHPCHRNVLYIAPV